MLSTGSCTEARDNLYDLRAAACAHALRALGFGQN